MQENCKVTRKIFPNILDYPAFTCISTSYSKKGSIPIQARPIHVGPFHVHRFMSERFMSGPIHVRPHSCPVVPIHVWTYSCPNWFMSSKYLQYSKGTDSCLILFMSDPIHVRPYSCPSLFMSVSKMRSLNHNLSKPNSRI